MKMPTVPDCGNKGPIKEDEEINASNEDINYRQSLLPPMPEEIANTEENSIVVGEEEDNGDKVEEEEEEMSGKCSEGSVEDLVKKPTDSVRTLKPFLSYFYLRLRFSTRWTRSGRTWTRHQDLTTATPD